jgi:hypothetical protein
LMISMVADRLCGSMPMMTCPMHAVLDRTGGESGEEGSATSSWAVPS